MCGIVGYVGARPCRELLLKGLEKLEYRGYDSAGISLLAGGRIDSVRAVGNLSFLREAVKARAVSPAGALGSPGEGSVATAEAPATTGIGHTRWATHGAVTEENAHPHTDTSERIHIVLNGIVENHRDLHRRLEADGALFTSQTDAEVVAHLIAAHYEGDLGEAVRRAYGELRGHYSIVAMCAEEPGLLVAARKETPLVVGLGDGETFVASAIPAFLAETRRILLVEDDEIVAVRADGVDLMDPLGRVLHRRAIEVDWNEEVAEKSGYETFMLKEIHEQPEAVAETIGDRLPEGERIELGDIGLSDEELAGMRRIVVVACGTSYHA